ncbi:hypothetical protein PL75_04720 [Neisseria arctica]|uniref:Uncharacterized protein n=1 Tax=Neisseria arctica TaxID=1470200 RepID=A0A0J0YSW7_9NEIS|nr:hypothetical protein PL75_04720 [Neisseria arctica]
MKCRNRNNRPQLYKGRLKIQAAFYCGYDQQQSREKRYTREQLKSSGYRGYLQLKMPCKPLFISLLAVTTYKNLHGYLPVTVVTLLKSVIYIVKKIW